MLFSSVTFLYYFLPITLIAYYLTPRPKGSLRWRNLTLLIMSMVFYAWSQPRYVLLMAAQCVSAWGLGLLAAKYSGAPKNARRIMLLSVAISLSGLLIFKYTNFFIENINRLGAHIPVLSLLMPVGISFYTFQLISYTVDVYKGRTEAQRNMLDFSVYVAMFPRLMAGPIVRYPEIAQEIGSREHSVARFALGARRLIIGLGKKMLLANLFAELVNIYKKNGDGSLLFTWLYIIAYALQIYFDFSGYSDMAIGLGHLFGFKFPENFDYPFTADSITTFWRRWHMSLSGWFRDYIYIPMGGNRVKTGRFILNILTVWALTGFWHGADWNYILWGAYFGVVLLIEKFFILERLEKAPGFLRHIYVMLIVSVSWPLFDSVSGGEALTAVGRMFGIGVSGIAGQDALYYLRSYAVPIIIGVIGATPLPKKLAARMENTKAINVLEPLVLVLILIVATACVVDGSFNPFIYFRF